MDEMELLVEAICRSCMATKCSSKFDLFEAPHLTELYIRLSSTSLDNEDCLPKSICLDCHNRLMDFDSFQKMCENSYEVLLHKFPFKITIKEERLEILVKEESPDPISVGPELEQQEITNADSKSEEEDVSEYDPLKEEDGNVENEVSSEEVEVNRNADVINNRKENKISSEMKCKNDNKKETAEKTKSTSKTATKQPCLPFTCGKCSKSFFKESRYEAHMRVHQELKPFADSESEEEDVSEYDPLKEETGSTEYEVDSEEDEVSSDEDEVNKKKEYPKLSKAKCKNDTKKETAEKIKSTSKTETKKPSLPFTCEKCSKSFFKESRYEAHMRVHQGLKPFACKLCKKEYKKQCRFTEHMRNEHSEIPVRFPCTIEGCDKIYKSKQSLKQHTENHFNPQPKIDRTNRPNFVCETCGKILKTKSSLQMHTMIHTNEFPFICDICPKKFRVEFMLNEHKHKHEDTMRFECEICGVKKATRAAKKSHMRIHTDPKSHICDVCSKGFRTKSLLKEHRRVVHERIKRFVCTHCGQRFGVSQHLKLHIRRHTGEKPFECPICGRKFSRKAPCQDHIKRHGKIDDSSSKAMIITSNEVGSLN